MKFEIDLTQEIIEAKDKFGGKPRSELKDSDFLYPETRSFPIKSAKDVKDAIRDFGRSKSKDSYETFLKKLHRKAKELGIENAIPESTRKEHNLE